MINERDIAEKFSVIWKQNLPMLTPNFMRVFNESHIERINTNSISPKDDIRYDIVSEVSYNLVEKHITENLSIDNFNLKKKDYAKIVEYTAKTIWSSGNYSKKDLILNKLEVNEVIFISRNTLEFINKVKKETIKFKPKLKGYGIIPDLVADMTIDETLYEIKTVNRNFKSSDLKQLFIYLAMQQLSGNKMWKYGGLYNPRRGTYCKFNIESLINNLSGGLSPNETFENLLNSLNRDIQIDSRF